MSRATQAEIDTLLNDAEAQGKCLVPHNRTIKQRLDRRSTKKQRRRQSRTETEAEADAVLQPYQGIYVRECLWQSLDPFERAIYAMRALCELHPSWTFCGVSAAIAYGLYLSWRYAQPLHAMLPANSRNHHLVFDNIVWDQFVCEANVTVAGVRITPLDQTAVRCLCQLPFCDALGIADSWMHISHISKQQALDIVNKLAFRKHGVKLARLAVSAADERSENGGESFARATMLQYGYQAPQLQVEIPDPVGDPSCAGDLSRVDYLWQMEDGTRVIGELDGAIKYRDPRYMSGLDSEEVRERERLRESRLAMPGTSVMRFSLADVRDHRRFCRLLDSYGIPQTSRSLDFAYAVRCAQKHIRRPQSSRPSSRTAHIAS